MINSNYCQTATAAYGSLTVRFCKVGKMVTCYIPPISNVTVAAWGTSNICAIPSGFIPVEGFRYEIPRQNQNNTIALFFLAAAAGGLAINNQSGNSLSTGYTMATAITWFTA